MCDCVGTAYENPGDDGLPCLRLCPPYKAAIGLTPCAARGTLGRAIAKERRMSRQYFRSFIPEPDKSRISGPTARAHTQARLKSPRAQELFGSWAKLAAEPFKGITTDGNVRAGLFSPEPAGAPTAAMVEAAAVLLKRVTGAERGRMCFPVDSPVWQQWQNTENHVEDYGLRLDETTDDVREAVMDVLRASLSQRGYEVLRNVMRLNRFLGDLVGGPAVLGEWSYTFCLYGSLSTSEAWGWQLFGHHLALNCLVIGGHMVLT